MKPSNAGTIRTYAAHMAKAGWTVGIRKRPFFAKSGRPTYVLCWGKDHTDVTALIEG